ncbi:hypothetical protein [Vannielia litorea]|uniref:Uncharacterized protein n=1 Tax=Vannielia litorea TaxID=1217970 RepID=A0A1N6F707_9RHOB|nr:hypothetical protein [Vannielia litorea]SIN90974.1 hypothetical protein SAMN05444002_1424 [Vannielia litorea]
MTNLAPLARQRRLSALLAIARPLASNVIAVDFRASRTRPVLPPNLGLRPAATLAPANDAGLALAA